MAHAYSYAHARAHAHSGSCARARPLAHAHMRTHTHTHSRTHTSCRCVCALLEAFVCEWVCVCVRSNKHARNTDTHTRTHAAEPTHHRVLHTCTNGGYISGGVRDCVASMCCRRNVGAGEHHSGMGCQSSAHLGDRRHRHHLHAGRRNRLQTIERRVAEHRQRCGAACHRRLIRDDRAAGRVVVASGIGSCSKGATVL